VTSSKCSSVVEPPACTTFRAGQKDESLHHLIDELDALGKSRDMGGGADKPFSRSNDEAEQTLNQLLACMDGLNNSRRICVLAATDRREVLDPALVRPGRFDRIVKLELPNAAGRERILRVHCAKLPNFVEGSGVDPKRPNALGQGRRVSCPPWRPRRMASAVLSSSFVQAAPNCRKRSSSAASIQSTS
jgi:hypothetical protein